MNNDYVIDFSVGCIESDKVKITSGPFKRCEGNVKKVNRRRMTAMIDLGLLGDRVE